MKRLITYLGLCLVVSMWQAPLKAQETAKVITTAFTPEGVYYQASAVTNNKGEAVSVLTEIHAPARNDRADIFSSAALKPTEIYLLVTGKAPPVALVNAERQTLANSESAEAVSGNVQGNAANTATHEQPALEQMQEPSGDTAQKAAVPALSGTEFEQSYCTPFEANASFYRCAA